jgi:predicted Zn-ribbon and HTH transcriptional regulator
MLSQYFKKSTMENIIQSLVEQSETISLKTIKAILIECNYANFSYSDALELTKKVADKQGKKLPTEFFETH